MGLYGVLIDEFIKKAEMPSKKWKWKVNDWPHFISLPEKEPHNLNSQWTIDPGCSAPLTLSLLSTTNSLPPPLPPSSPQVWTGACRGQFRDLSPPGSRQKFCVFKDHSNQAMSLGAIYLPPYFLSAFLKNESLWPKSLTLLRGIINWFDHSRHSNPNSTISHGAHRPDCYRELCLREFHFTQNTARQQKNEWKWTGPGQLGSTEHLNGTTNFFCSDSWLTNQVLTNGVSTQPSYCRSGEYVRVAIPSPSPPLSHTTWIR